MSKLINYDGLSKYDENIKKYIDEKNSSDLSEYYKSSEVDTLLLSKTNDNELAPVAKSGSYNDLTDKPNVTNITYGTEDLTAGVSELATGSIYLVYEE